MRRLFKISAPVARKSLGFVRYGESRCVRRNAKASAAAGGVFHTAIMESTFLSIIIHRVSWADVCRRVCVPRAARSGNAGAVRYGAPVRRIKRNYAKERVFPQ